MDRARLFLKRGLLALGLLIAPTLLLAQGPYSAQIQQALQAFVQQAHTWTATQTFDDVTVTGTCTGCGGGAGGLTLLESHTAAATASLDFTTCISSTYDQYLFEMVGILPATDGADLIVRVGTGAGPSWDTGSNYYWFYSGHSLLGGFTGQGNPGTSVKLAPDIENSVTGVGSDFTLYNPQDTGGRKVIAWNAVANFSDGNVGRISGGAVWNSSTAVTGVQALYSSGNIASGTMRCYGLAK